MIAYPCCKINLGLNIVNKRKDGYHNLETIFYPVPLHDVIEINKMHEDFPSMLNCDIKVTGTYLNNCDDKDNLVVKAYNLLAKRFYLPRIHAHLYKQIPSQAGLGGGSADAAYMIKMLNEHFQLKISNDEMQQLATKLGADCAFFINAKAAFATGIGNELTPIKTEINALKGCYLTLIKPDIAISTAEAYSNIKPQQPKKCCKDIISQPISTWKEELKNDFEEPLFTKYTELKDIKKRLYEEGALYAQMSGSGSTIFGIFDKKPKNVEQIFKGNFIYNCSL
jgi:4-(cytidine 5'-diphospho)-2-C-methyl-D-erythritol kinase